MILTKCQISLNARSVIEMPYHIRVKSKSSRFEETRVDLTRNKLLDDYVIPYSKAKPLWIGGTMIMSDDIDQVRITWTTEYSSKILPVVREDRARERKGRALITTISDEWHVANRGRDVTHEFIAGPPGSGKIPSHAIVDSEYPPKGKGIVMTSEEAIRIINEVKSGYADLSSTFTVKQVELTDEMQLAGKMDESLAILRKIEEYNRPKSFWHRFYYSLIDETATSIALILIGSAITALCIWLKARLGL